MREILQLCGLISEKGKRVKDENRNKLGGVQEGNYVFAQGSQMRRDEGQYFLGNCLTFTGIPVYMNFISIK